MPFLSSLGGAGALGFGLSKKITAVGGEGAPGEYATFVVSGDNNNHVLYTAFAGSVTTGPVYTDTGLTTSYTGVFTYSGTTYYANSGTPHTYRAWSVSADTNSNVLYTAPAGDVTTDTVRTNTGLTTSYTGVFTYSGTTYYADLGTPNIYRAWTVSNDTNSNVLYTAPAGNVLSSTVFTAANMTSGYTGAYTSNSTNKYAVAGVPQDYISIAVTADIESGLLYADPLFTGAAGQSVYLDSLLTDAYTGYYAISDTPYYALNGVLLGYRPWAVTGDTNSATTLYTIIKSSIASGDTIYLTTGLSGGASYGGNGSFYIGTEGSVGYKKVTVTSAVVSAILTIDHGYNLTYSGTTYYHDNATLVAGDFVYTGQYSEAKAVDLLIYTGTVNTENYTRINTGGAGAVSTIALVDHSHTSESFYYDNATLVVGDFVYVGQYTDQLASSGSFYVGSNNNAGYGTATVGAGGTATIVYVDHGFNRVINASTGYYDVESIATGAQLYIGQYSTTALTTQGGSSFYFGTENAAGYSLVTVDGGGIMTRTAINHAYSFVSTSSVTIYHDSTPLTTGATLYTGQYTEASYTTAFTYYTGAVGDAGYTRVTQGSTPGTTLFTLVDHSNGVNTGNYTVYFDNSPFLTGDTAYQGRYTDAVSTGSTTNWSSGTENSIGYTTYTLSTAGVVTIYVVNHSTTYAYNSVDYYTDSSIGTGVTVYTSQYGNTHVASATIFAVYVGSPGALKIVIGASGVATATAINHSYAFNRADNNTSVYADSATLTNGDVMYQGRYTLSVAASIPTSSVGTEGIAGYGTFVTNSDGVIALSPVNHTYEYIASNIASNTALPPIADNALNITVYVNRYSNQPAATTTFRIGGLVYTVTSGVLVSAVSFSGYESGQVWVTGSQIAGVFTGPTDYTVLCDDDPSPTLKLVKTGLNLADKVYKTETKNISGVFVADFGAYTGIFSDGSMKYTVSAGSIAAVYTCTAYGD